MKILLTGATGFLGSNILNALLKNKHKVIILKRSFSNIKKIEKNIEKVKFYNIDEVNLEKVFIENKIEAIIHTATCYGRNNESLTTIIDANLNFPIRLLELAIKYNIKTFFNTDTLAYDYLNNYTLSKKQFLEWLESESKKGNIQGINLKLEHMYGIRDDETKFVPWLINKIWEDKEDIKLTKGEQKRDFIYIDDVVNAFLILLKKKNEMSIFESFDIGTGNQIKLKDFIMLIFEEINKIKPIKHKLIFGAIPYRKNEMMEVNEDVSKIKKIGWNAKINYRDNIVQIIKKKYV